MHWDAAKLAGDFSRAPAAVELYVLRATVHGTDRLLQIGTASVKTRGLSALASVRPRVRKHPLCASPPCPEYRRPTYTYFLVTALTCV